MKINLIFLLSVLYIKIEREPKLQPFKESTSTVRNSLAKLSLPSLLSLTPIVPKFWVTSISYSSGYECCFDPPPELWKGFFVCLGLKNRKKIQKLCTIREGRGTSCLSCSAHCKRQLVQFYSALSSISWEQLFIEGMDNSIDCYKFDWLNRQIGTVSPSLPAICFFLNIW